MNTKYLIGFLAGVFFILLVCFVYCKFFLSDTSIEYYSFHDNSALVDEKIKFVNKRIDDFYILGGIIITLLLAVIASVYIRTEHEVNRHLSENYDHYRKKIEEKYQEAEQLVGKIKTELEFAEKSKKSTDGTNDREPQ